MKAFKRILVTSALPYANGPLHLGHIAGAYLPADIYVRYQRLKNRDVIYICGSDEHGVPITVTADKEGSAPQNVVDRFHAMNKEDFSKLGICFDNYSRTSLSIHHKTARQFFTKLYEQGDLTVHTEEQFYSEKSQRFLPDRYVEGTCPYCRYDKARGDQCDSCGKWLDPKQLIDPKSKTDGSTPVLKETKHWYFPMGRFAEDWKQWFNSQQWKENVRNYCMGWYNEGLGERPITRDLHWGVPVPLDNTEGKVLYVWFDAPIGYISSTKEWAKNQGAPDQWKKYWCDNETKLVHFIGKDNIVFHAILFPMMLKRMGNFVLPSAIPANEYLTIEGRKISTSQNYAVWLKDYLASFPPDPLRYTLAANAPESKDTDFSWKQLQSRNNDELADILGNFVNRTLIFVHNFFEGKIPPRIELDAMDKQMLKTIQNAPGQVGTQLENFEIRNATKTFMDVCRTANKYFNDKAPWSTRKTDPEVCATTLNVCLHVVNVLSVIMMPILPFSAEKIRSMLNIESVNWDDVAHQTLPADHPLGEAGILFNKIEDSMIEKEVDKLNALAGEPSQELFNKKDDLINFDQFQKMHLKTARVMKAERVKGTDKLLKLHIDLGDEKRQIIAGIAQDYTPEDIVNRTIIVVTNLKPAVIRGEESQGMLLAVRTKESLKLLTADGNVPPGERVS
ncbi:methionine--tRNA ligase [bacterium]|nr:methionine--tRNA ligase [bacterium]